MIRLQGMNVVVTGKIAGETRSTAEAKLTSAGATVQSAVGPKTDLLVMGEGTSARSKARKADELGVRKVTWAAVWEEADGALEYHDLGPGPAAGETMADSYSPVRVIAPMLAKDAKGEVPVGDGWLYEIKWDGVRCVAEVVDGKVAMTSRSAKTDWTEQFPAIAKALARLPFDVVLDGEIVTPDENGHTFGLAAGAGSKVAARLVVFDVLECFGSDTKAMPLTDRRKVLDTLTPALAAEGPGVLEVSPTFTDGEALLGWVATHGLEGIVAKQKTSRYIEGRRGDEWLKVKVRREQEFVVCGWTPGKNGRVGRIGGLVLGMYDDNGELVYCGRAGMAEKYDAELEREWLAGTGTIPQRCPFPRMPKEEREATWVVPELVIQVAYQRWTPEGRLQHPVMKSIRRDKDARDVTKEGAE